MPSLDFIMYFVTCYIVWGFLEIASKKQFTEEMGALIGIPIMGVYTIIYIILFSFIDYNWIDIFTGSIDFIMYWILFGLVWWLLGIVSNNEFTLELGAAFIGLPVMIIFTIGYIVLFGYMGYNWIEILNPIYDYCLNQFNSLEKLWHLYF